MKKALSLVFVLILMLGFVACKSNETGDIDTFAPNENSSGVESIALGVQTVELCLDAVSDDAQQTETIFYKGIMPSEVGFRFSSGL